MSQPTCVHCETATTDLKRCSRCEDAFYCSIICEEAHWNQHRPACSQTKTIKFHCTVDRSVTRAFPTFLDYKLICDRAGKKQELPRGCFTGYREPDGQVVVVVDEEKWQNHLRKVEEKIKNTAKSTEASLKDDVVGECEDESCVEVKKL